MKKQLFITGALVAALSMPAISQASGPRECDINPDVPCPEVSAQPIADDKDDSVFPERIPTTEVAQAAETQPVEFKEPATLPETGSDPLTIAVTSLFIYLAGVLAIGVYRNWQDNKREEASWEKTLPANKRLPGTK